MPRQKGVSRSKRRAKRYAALQVQIGGGHYKDMAIEPAEYIMRNGIPWAEGSAIKYLSRHRKKAGAEDVKKAIHFCQMVLELEYGMTAKVEYHEQSNRRIRVRRR